MRNKITRLLILFLSLFSGVSTLKAQVLLSEDFSTDPPAGWTATDLSNDGVNWAFDNPGDRDISGGSPGFDANFAILDSDEQCGSDENASLESPTFDASTGSIILEFDNSYRAWGSPTATVDVWNGTSWTTVLSINTASSDGYPDANHKSIDITAAAGASASAKIRFLWDNGSCDYWWAIDNVTITQLNCTSASATFSGNLDCANNQFYVDADISDMGSAGSLQVTDDQGSTAQTATAIGTITMGPYTYGTEVTLTITNADDVACHISSDPITYAGCPPANDECINAIAFPAIPTDGTCASVTANTDFATQSLPGCAGTADDDVWYSFVCPAGTDSVLFQNTSVSGSTDRVIQFFSGDCDNLVSLKCSDPESGGLGGLIAGNTYYLRIYTYGSGNATEVSVCLKVPPPPPANDDCSNAVALTVNPDLECGTVTSGTTEGATASDETSPDCGSSGTNDDVWFSFVATQAVQTISLQNVSGSTDMAMAVYSGTCGNLTSLTCSDPNTLTVAGLTVGETYYVRVWTYSSTATTRASFDICVGTPPPPPANDDCSGAIAFPAIPTDGTCASVIANTAWATQSMSGCAGTADDDIWYSFVCPAGVDSLLFQNTSISGSTDRVIQFFSGDCDNLVSLKCSDPESGGIGGLIAGNTYYLRVYTYGSGNSTEVSVCLRVVPPPPVNDDCSGAIAFPAIPTDGTCASVIAYTESATQSVSGCTGTADDDIWYSFVCPAGVDSLLFQNTSISGSTDRVIQFFSGDCDNLVSLKCSDPESGGIGGLIAGNTYYLRVYTYGSGNATEVSICLKVVPPVPTNDACANAIALPCDGTLTGDNTSAADDDIPSVSCGSTTSGARKAVWYTITPTYSGDLTVSTCGSAFDTYLRVFEGTCDNFTACAGSNDDDDGNCDNNNSTVTFTATAGTMYYILLGGYGTSSYGSFIITATCPPPPPIDSVVVSTDGNVLPTITTDDGTLQLDATVYPAEADQSVTWSIIAETGSATIDANGLVTAVSNGTVWAKAVSVSDNTMADSIEITISNQIIPVDSVVVTTSGSVSPTITIDNGTLQLVATVYPAEADQSVTWSIIPETGDAAIDANGLVTATLNGTVWAKAVSVFDNTMSDSIEITISNQVVPVDSLVVTTAGSVPATITTNTGTLQLVATVYPAEADQNVTWSIIPGTGDATIDANGLVTAVTNGTVWAKAVSAFDNTMADSIEITISNQIVPVDSLVVTTDGNVTATITTNAGSLQLVATVYPAEADQSVTWSIIPETGDATIDADGLVTATLNGTVWAKAVSVTDNTMMDSIEITISNQLAPPDSVVVNTDANLPPVITTVGGTLLMNAIVYPIDADQEVSWSIIPGTGTASITSGGLVTAIDDGTVWAKAVSVADPLISDSLLITINQSTGVKQVEDAIGFKLYPNPTNNGLNLVITKPHPELTVTIIDASGREVTRKRYEVNELNTPQQLSVSHLPAGAYFISVNGNGINFSTPFIKQ